MGEFDEALAHYDASIEASRSLDAGALEARVLIPKASCLQAIGRPKEAHEAVDRALAIASSLGDEALLARVHRALLLLARSTS